MLNLEVKTVYKTGPGAVLNGGKSGWIPISLNPHEETEYDSVSLTNEAADFMVHIRLAPAKDSAANP